MYQIRFDETTGSILIEISTRSITQQLTDIKGILHQMQLDSTALKAAVARITEVDGSIKELVVQMAAHLKDLATQLAAAIAAGSDPVKIAAIQADMDASAATLIADADSIVKTVTDNTPAAPVPPAA